MGERRSLDEWIARPSHQGRHTPAQEVGQDCIPRAGLITRFLCRLEIGVQIEKLLHLDSD